VTLGAGGLLFLVVAIGGRLPVMLPVSIVCFGVAILLARGPHRKPPKFAIGMTFLGAGAFALLLLASLVLRLYQAAFGAGTREEPLLAAFTTVPERRVSGAVSAVGRETRRCRVVGPPSRQRGPRPLARSRGSPRG